MDLSTKVAVGCAVFLAPLALVEIWWKQRRRRANEQLLVFPEPKGRRVAK